MDEYPIDRQIEVPKTVKVYLIILNYCYGFNFGVSKLLKSTTGWFPNLSSYFVGLVVHLILMAPLYTPPLSLTNYLNFICYTLTLFEYSITFFIVQFTKYNICDFIIEINQMDINIEEIRKQRIGIIAFLYSDLLYAMRFILYVFVCESIYDIYCQDLIIPYYINLIPGVYVDIVVSTIQIMIFSYVYYCVKNLNDHILDKEHRLKHVLKNYIDLVDCYGRIKPLCDKMAVVQLIFDVPKMLGMIYYILTQLRSGNGWAAYSGETADLFHIILHITTPAVVAEMINYKNEAMRLNLHKRLALEQDDHKLSEALRLLRYLEARPILRRAFRLIPVCLRLPFSLFSFCVTYLIVIIQFTHLYD